jgi:hypothetical protein
VATFLERRHTRGCRRAPARGYGEPLARPPWGDDDENGNDSSPRLGVILNYRPTRILYVSEPFENTVAAIDLVDDGVIFRVAAANS